MDTGQLVTTVFAVLAVVTGGSSALLLGTVGGLRKDREDYVARDERKTAELAETNTRLARVEASLVAVVTERDALGAQLRGDDALAKLGMKLNAVADILAAQADSLDRHNETLTEHNTMAVAHWGTEEGILSDAVSLLKELRTTLGHDDERGKP